jgi:hypothetical protein
VIATVDSDFPMLIALRRSTSPSIVLLRGVNELPPTGTPPRDRQPARRGRRPATRCHRLAWTRPPQSPKPAARLTTRPPAGGRGELEEVFAESVGPATNTSGRLRHGLRAIARFFTDDPATGRAMVRAWLRAGGPLLTPGSETPHMFASMIRTGRERIYDGYPDVALDMVASRTFDGRLQLLEYVPTVLTGPPGARPTS